MHSKTMIASRLGLPLKIGGVTEKILIINRVTALYSSYSNKYYQITLDMCVKAHVALDN
jgi:hypothetical protein